MCGLRFRSNKYGTWECKPYSIEFFDGFYHCFKNLVLFGPPFTKLDGAVDFCEADQ